MIFKLTHAQAKQLPWYICYFLVFIQFHVNGQNGEIRDCNVRDIITQVTVRSSNNQQLTLTNCTYTQGKLYEYLNCIKNINPSLPATASLIVTMSADPTSGILTTDLLLLKDEILQKSIISNTCNRVGSDTDSNNKINTIDLCLLRKDILGLSNLTPSWKFYKSQNLSLTGIGANTDLVFPIADFPLSTLKIVGVHNGNVNQVTTPMDTCVLLCKPDLRITPGKDEVRKLTTDYFMLNKSCSFPNLSLQILNAAGQNIGNDITQNMVGSQLTAQLRIDDTTQTCTTKLTVYPCETFVNIDVDQINTTDSTFVDVSVRNAEDIAGYQLSLKFDTSHLQFVKIEKGTESAFNVSNDANYNTKSHVNISRFKESSTLGLVNGTRLFRIKFKRKSSTVNNVTLDPENVETLFFDLNKNEYCTDITYVKDTKSPVCIQDTINILASQTNGFGIVEFTDYASDDFGTVFFVGGIDEFDFPITNIDTFNCGTNILTNVTFKDANDQFQQCTFRVVVECPSDNCLNKFLYLDGVDDRINIPNQHTGNVDFTIESWFKSDNTDTIQSPSFNRLFSIGSNNVLDIGDQRGRLILNNNGGISNWGPNIRDDKWHHLALVRSNQKLKIYFDGKVLTENINSTSVDIGAIRVGYRNNSNLNSRILWKGGIDEIKFWNYGLSQTEINNSKNKINTKKKDCGLIGYWRMEEGIPVGNNQGITMIRDSVGTNQGTLVGFNLTGNTSNFLCNDSIQLLNDNSGCCDDKRPIFQNCPTGLIGFAGSNCNAIVPFSAPVALDPCNNLEALVECTRSDDKTLSEPYPVGKTSITCIAIGSNLLRDTCIFEVEVRDTIQPICKTKTLNKIINGNGNASFAAIELNDNSTDNCGNITFSASKTTFICADVDKTNIVTLTVTDQSNNSSSCPVEVKLTDPNNYCACLNDVTKPVCKTKNISLFLDGTGKANLTPAMINDGSFDACTDVTLQIEGPQSFDCNTLGKQTVNLVVTDVAKNVSFCTAEVTVRDTIKPTCNMQSTTFYLGTNGQVSVSNGHLSLSLADNCAGSTSTLSQTVYTCTDIGSKNIMATVNDAAGNTNTCSALITIRDTIRPTCTISPRTIFLGTNGQASLTQAQLNITANDNCTGAISTFNIVNYTCTDLGTKNISAIVRDVAGNTNTCTTQITVIDTIKPTCTVQPKTFYLDNTGKISVQKSQLIINPMDNCVQATTTFNTQNYSCTDLGSKSITVTVTDGSGNTNVCTTQLTVRDTIKPVCKTKTINKSIESNGSVTISANELNNNSTDNCDTNLKFSVAQTIYTCQDLNQIHIVELTVEDQSGNKSYCPTEIKLTDPNNYCACLNDLTKPICKTKNISLFIDGAGKVNLTPSMINDGSFDACTDVVLQIEGPQSFDCSTLGKQTVNLVVTDFANNVSFCTAEVTVRDTIKPTCNMQSTTFYLGTNGQVSVSKGQLSLSLADNCNGSTSTLSQTVYTCTDIGTKNIMATVRDVTGNSNTCSTQITIRDTIRPTCSIPPRTIFLGTNGQAGLTQAQLNIIANDNCTGVITTFNAVNYNCNDIGTKNIMATVRDVAGNTNTCSAQITIRDTIRPICIIRDTIVTATDGLGALVNFAGTALDNCGNPAITYSSPSGQMYTCGEYNITMTAKDGSGNTSTCPFKLTVKDCDGCCLSENVFMDSTSREFQLESSLFQNNCKFILKPPLLSECQYITALDWGDGTKSELMLSYKDPVEHFYQKEGTYRLCVTYSELNGPTGCFTNTICDTIQIFTNCTFSRSVNGSSVSEIVKVYPNPTNNIFYIELEGSAVETIKSYTLTNVAGQKFYLNAIRKENKLLELDGTTLSPSLYLLSVELSNGVVINKKVIRL